MLGSFAAIYSIYPLIIFGIGIFFPFLCSSINYKKIVLFAAIMAAFAFISTKAKVDIPLPDKGLYGEGEIEIVSVTRGERNHRTIWKYKALLRDFSSLSLTTKIPIFFTLPGTTTRLRGDGIYKGEGTLLKMKNETFLLKPTKNKEWKLLGRGWSLEEIRFLSKEKIASYLKENFTPGPITSFIAGLATGDFHDPMMAQELGRFGLQHIMAISGFHFAILAALFAAILRGYLARRPLAILLLILMTSYFLLIGMRPSIFRAWMGVTLYLGSSLFERNNSSLNNLGFALIILLLFDPLLLFNLGCQLSFLATAAILFFYAPAHQLISKIFRKRRLGEASRMNGHNQHAYVVLNFLASGLALSLAVHAVLLPFLLYLFGQFPVMSFVYNLFFPFAVSIIIFLLIVGTCLHLLIPPLGELVHAANQALTEGTLAMVYNVPLSFDLMIQTKEISVTFVCCYLFVALLLGIYLYELREEDFAYL